MSIHSFWQIWLRPNSLTRDTENDYVAEVSTTLRNTLHNEDLARLIVESRSEMHYETILSILQRRDALVRKILLDGKAIQDDNIHLKPRVLGSWQGVDPVFNPKEHKITVDASPTSQLRRLLRKEVRVQLLGKKTDGGARIDLVTDVSTGRTDGHITPGGNIIIRGVKIKIAPLEPSLGVFFVASDGHVIPLDTPPAENRPRSIICSVPAGVRNGLYTLQIHTRYSSSNGILLNAPRTLVYDLPLCEDTGAG